MNLYERYNYYHKDYGIVEVIVVGFECEGQVRVSGIFGIKVVNEGELF